MTSEMREEVVLQFIRENPRCGVRQTIRGVAHIMTTMVAWRAIHRLIDDGRVSLEITVRPGGKRKIYSLTENDDYYLIKHFLDEKI